MKTARCLAIAALLAGLALTGATPAFASSPKVDPSTPPLAPKWARDTHDAARDAGQTSALQEAAGKTFGALVHEGYEESFTAGVKATAKETYHEAGEAVRMVVRGQARQGAKHGAKALAEGAGEMATAGMATKLGGAAIDFAMNNAETAGAYAGGDDVGVQQGATHAVLSTGWGIAGATYGTAVGGPLGGAVGGVLGSMAGAVVQHVAKPFWDWRRESIDDRKRFAGQLGSAIGYMRAAANYCFTATKEIEAAHSRIYGAQKSVDAATREIETAMADTQTLYGEADSACMAAPDDVPSGVASLKEKMASLRRNSLSAMRAADNACQAPTGPVSEEAVDAAKMNIDSAAAEKDSVLADLSRAASEVAGLKNKNDLLSAALEKSATAKSKLDEAGTAIQNQTSSFSEAETSLEAAGKDLANASAEIESCKNEQTKAQNALRMYNFKDRPQAIQIMAAEKNKIREPDSLYASVKADLGKGKTGLSQARGKADNALTVIGGMSGDLAGCSELKSYKDEVASLSSLVKTYQANLPRDLSQKLSAAQACLDQMIAMAAVPEDGGADPDSLREAESKTSEAEGASDTGGYDEAMDVNTAGDTISGQDDRAADESTDGGVTITERAAASGATHEGEMEDIAGQGMETERNIATSRDQHESAETAKAGEREEDAILTDSIAGGLTGGVSTGVGVFGEAVGGAMGREASERMGITPEARTGHTHGPDGSDVSAQPGSTAGGDPAGYTAEQKECMKWTQEVYRLGNILKQSPNSEKHPLYPSYASAAQKMKSVCDPSKIKVPAKPAVKQEKPQQREVSKPKPKPRPAASKQRPKPKKKYTSPKPSAPKPCPPGFQRSARGDCWKPGPAYNKPPKKKFTSPAPRPAPKPKPPPPKKDGPCPPGQGRLFPGWPCECLGGCK